MPLVPKANPTAILLKGDPPRKEGLAAGAIRAGDLIEINAPVAGQEGLHDVDVHGVADINALPAFAMPNPWLEGTPPAGSTFVSYASGDTVMYVVCQPGDEVFAWISDGEVIAAGDALVSGGTGALDAAAAGTDPDKIVGYAREAISPSGADELARIEVA